MSNQDYQYHAMMKDVGEIIAQDHSYVVDRIGEYTVNEGAGVDGGFWFAKGRGENKRFKSRQDAVSHARSSTRAATGDEALKPKLVPVPKVGAGGDKALDAMDPELKTKRAKLRDTIKYWDGQNNDMRKYYGRESPSAIAKRDAAKAELEALGKE